jgi:hypothetical protein
MNETSADQTKESPKVTTKAKKAVKDEFFSKPNASLEDAKKWLRERFGKGATCPCCNQFVKLYRRPFNYSMAVVLLLMERYYRRVGVSAEEWLHVPSYITEAVAYHPRGAVAIRGGDWAKMKYWGLIEEKPEVRDDGSPRAGYWRMTPLGRQFATRAAKVASHVYIYNGEPMQKTADEQITIDDALGTHFNYADLMADA